MPRRPSTKSRERNCWQNWGFDASKIFMETLHVPVLLAEAVNSLNCRPNGIYLDATVGSGGHAYQILKDNPEIKRLIAIDWDKDAIERARHRLRPFSHKTIILQDNFTNIRTITKQLGIKEVNGILIDLGVSSQQLEDENRGFSFRYGGPLDMRMDRSQTMTAADLVNNCSLAQLERIIRDYGEERWAKRIAGTLVRERRREPISDTVRLSSLVTASIPSSRRPRKIHPATKTFQALRIAVNHELDNLSKVIDEAVKLLAHGGRLCIISFHSLEDRIVKLEFKKRAGGNITPSRIPIEKKHPATLRIITKKPVVPQGTEARNNPRARSAKLRVAEKV